MTQSAHALTEVEPSLWVARKHGKVQMWRRSSRGAVKWLNANADTMNGWTITKSYTVTIRYRNHATQTWFEPELHTEHPSFGDAMEQLVQWLHASWEQDRSNHPSPAGRAQAWSRWNDVLALANLADLTLLPNPAFKYRFGPLSPPEGKGHELVITVVPTSRAMLDSMVERNVGCGGGE